MKNELKKYAPVLNLVNNIMRNILGSYRYCFNDIYDELISELGVNSGNGVAQSYELKWDVDMDLCQDLTEMFGKYCELWDGRPNEYLTSSLILELKKQFDVPDELYKDYFTLPINKRIALLKKFN